ncbi:hypothetical protein ASE63_22255 [Bosea sp. Root381]|uniref:hypothetical protein n=1 Tax=Bosea sp. Root381 TaxID=1736524 RepID=UPI0006FA137D|nr:hypothetical protein [Bosea sp. Root381]KRE07425.1 hypothetical protein ASE63_22255 [Bosea sp. Root381]
MIRALAHQALSAFLSWRRKRREAKAASESARRLAAANPEIQRLRAEIAARARKHRAVQPLRRQLHALMIAQLAKEQGRTFTDRSFG